MKICFCLAEVEMNNYLRDKNLPIFMRYMVGNCMNFAHFYEFVTYEILQLIKHIQCIRLFRDGNSFHSAQ